MHATWRSARAVWLMSGVLMLTGVATARAQTGSTGAGRSLGGYGAMTAAGPGMAMSGPAIPYAGRFGGFMPYRMGGSGSLAFPARGNAPVGSGRTSFSLSPMSGGMGSGMGSRVFTSPGATGSIGSTGGMSSMSGMGSPGVMPPSFAYPFRQPPSLVPAATSAMGMSM
jgi:hypothetical protein